jgi:hypothetical protein
MHLYVKATTKYGTISWATFSLGGAVGLYHHMKSKPEYEEVHILDYHSNDVTEEMIDVHSTLAHSR